MQRINLSEGVWNKKGNLLILFDSSIKAPFYILISEKYLISKLLPTDYNGCTFVKK